MKKIQTAAITTNKRLPFYGNRVVLTGIDFLQQAHLDTQQAIMGMLVTDDTKATILYGCGAYPGPVIGSGYVFFRLMPSDQGEIFEVPVQNVGAYPGPGWYLAATINPNPTDAHPNESVYSDSSLGSVHEQRTIILNWVNGRNTGDLPDMDLWLPSLPAVQDAFIITINAEIAAINAEIAAINAEIAAIDADITVLQSYLPGPWLPLSGLGAYAVGWGPGNDINGIDTPYYRIVTDPTGRYIEFKGSVGVGLSIGSITKQTIMTGVSLPTARANIGSVVFSATDSFAAIPISNETAVFYYSLADQNFYLTTPTNTLDMNKMILDGTKWYLS